MMGGKGLGKSSGALQTHVLVQRPLKEGLPQGSLSSTPSQARGFQQTVLPAYCLRGPAGLSFSGIHPPPPPPCAPPPPHPPAPTPHLCTPSSPPSLSHPLGQLTGCSQQPAARPRGGRPGFHAPGTKAEVAWRACEPKRRSYSGRTRRSHAHRDQAGSQCGERVRGWRPPGAWPVPSREACAHPVQTQGLYTRSSTHRPGKQNRNSEGS